MTAGFLIVSLLFVLFYGTPFIWMLVLDAMALVAAYEWGRLALWSPQRSFMYASLLALLLGIWIRFSATAMGDHLLHQVALLSLLFWGGGVLLWLRFGYRSHHPMILIVSGMLVILPGLMALWNLRQQGSLVLLVAMGVIWSSDSVAYFVGRQWGVAKLAPSISPGKTWVGAIGGLVGALFYGACIGFFMGRYSSEMLLPYIILIILMVILGIEGDLFESWIKRCAGVKDSGRCLPGHGGLLDRIDALTPTMPLVVLFLHWFPL